MSDQDTMRQAFGSAEVTPFVEEFITKLETGDIQINCEELHKFFTKIFDAGIASIK